MRLPVIFVLVFWPHLVAAEALLGTWLSPPDARGQTGHVVMRSCSDGMCGTLERAFGSNGSAANSRNLGRRLLFNVRPIGRGEYQGRAFVPLLGRDYPATLSLQGDQLLVTGCAAGAICKKQIWKRVGSR